MTLDGTIPAGFASCSPLVLNAGLPAPVDLYVRYPGDSTMVLFLSAGQQFSADELKRIESHDLRLMYEPQNHSTMHMVLQEQLIRYLGSPKIPDIRQAAMMVEVLRGELAQALATNSVEQIYDTALTWTRVVVRSLPKLKISAQELMYVVQRDDSLATHLCNAAVFACLLGHAQGYTADELQEFVTGAIMYDVGMLDVPTEIRDYPGKLEAPEMRIVREHPISGFRRLATLPTITKAQLLMSYEHHERPDGNGYPVGLPGHLISPWSKLISVVDVFTAMTCERAYRKALGRRQALSAMRRMAGTVLDEESLRCWESMMQTPAKS